MSKDRPKTKQCKRCWAHYEVKPRVRLDMGGALMQQSKECPHDWKVVD